MIRKRALYAQSVGLQIPTITTVPLWSLGIDLDPWVFTSGQPGIDTAGAYSPDAADQTWQALENLRAIVEQAGLAFSDIGKLVVYLRDQEMWPAAAARLLRYLRDHFRDGELPAITAVAAPLTVATLHVEIEAIACRRRVPLGRGDFAAAVAEASSCVEMGGLVFVSGQAAAEGDRGSGVEVELLGALARLAGALEAAGARLDDLVRLSVYVGDVSADRAVGVALDRWLSAHLREAPAVSILFAGSFRGAAVEVEAVASLGLDVVRSYAGGQAGRPSAVRAGPLIYLSQQDARDESGTLAGDIKGQARVVLEKAERVLRAAGAEFGDVVHVLIWHGQPGTYEPLNEVRVPFYRSRFADGAYPASTAVPAPLPDGELIRFEAVASCP